MSSLHRVSAVSADTVLTGRRQPTCREREDLERPLSTTGPCESGAARYVTGGEIEPVVADVADDESVDQLGPQGVTVTTLHPGATRRDRLTDLLDAAPDDERARIEAEWVVAKSTCPSSAVR